ncbi:unnamed protein product [Paramecium pentaurelia]|uniref:Uncharacterized protein n=1 Tax=Paramecium pentaurelia TaxID=43138 RepID=A0A8S1TIZ3_9CILI|nr:unnamed protein product [Paramecium pentaurelia]
MKRDKSSFEKLPLIAQCRLSLKNIMSLADLNQKQSVSKHSYQQPLTERPPRNNIKVHSSILEFKQNYKRMLTNSKYGINYMQKKVFSKLDPL